MDSDEEEFTLISNISMFLLYRRWKRKQKSKEKERKWWVKPWIAHRNELGAYHTLVQELKSEDHDSFSYVSKFV